MGLREALQAFLDHRREVLVRRSTFRLAEIERRLEILDGYLIAYLNLDKVIQIIRDEDEPKPKMIKAFKLTDLQAEAILNMRLRALRRLEEFEIKGEHKKLTAERKDLKALLKDEKLQWGKIADEVQETKRKFGGKTTLGQRRTELADAPAEVEHAVEDFVEREPVTIVLLGQGLDPRRQGPSRREGRGRAQVQGRRRARALPCTPSRPTRSWCSAPTAASTRWAATSCRARAAMASRSA